MLRRGSLDHDEECELLMYEGGICTCPDEDEPPRWDTYGAPVHGEEPSTHDGRLAGPALDW
ncbi:hypothetical protein QMK19_33780 [Streptomyces sp. H10-C2]|uniref:hypothetical protein n=1 Tax=unclassified Streptomyces TaxID=2593676 RepID=UPI0024BB76DE|nr:MULTISPECIES: hypothetical protein [unclassified Streptomyces]MDJ0345518.1 hypothetical protein [Streptomyces sp. PH10-H1]MDJ0374464.1 hypothetical protein [Streptomyces sp. H10-C2]